MSSHESSSKAIRIANTQLAACINNPPMENIILIQDEENPLKIQFCIESPTNSFWAGKTLYGTIILTNHYPFEPPSVQFNCNLYHPNIYPDGKVCISILLKEQDEFKYFEKNELWSPAIGLDSLIISIWNILIEPNIDSPANVDAAKDYRTDLDLFKKKTQEYLRV